MSSEALSQQFNAAFAASAQEGIIAFKEKSPGGNEPVLSHVCFKFKDKQAYQDYIAAASELGVLRHEEFGGKEITWCQLKEPLEKNGLKLEWLELIEPKNETHHMNGVSGIGYYVPEIGETVKIQASDKNLIFRYQSFHASALPG